MPEFLRLSPPMQALQILLDSLPEMKPADEAIGSIDALGRVLAADVRAPHSLPEFPRSSVDGFAVRANDTFGVSEALPGYLQLVGEILMGKSPTVVITPDTCVSIHTGGMLPDGANAVMMLEHSQTVKRRGPGNEEITEIEILRPVAVGENVILVGEDVKKDQIVLKAGSRIRPAEIGGSMALGISLLRVAIPPRIGIISSGDEVVPPDCSPQPGQVRDVNSHSLAALVKGSGGDPLLYGIVPDNLQAMKSVAGIALNECDAILITAGSSASARDHTAEAIASLGEPGILVHGVNVRPGKPTILAVCGGKAVIGLPGNPVSALVIGKLFAIPIIERMLGLNVVRPHPSVMAKMEMNIASQAGREDWVAVRIHSSPSQSIPSEERIWMAEPIFGKSNLIFSLAAADGLVRIPPNSTGVSSGEMVEVVLL